MRDNLHIARSLKLSQGGSFQNFQTFLLQIKRWKEQIMLILCMILILTMKMLRLYYQIQINLQKTLQAFPQTVRQVKLFLHPLSSNKGNQATISLSSSKIYLTSNLQDCSVEPRFQRPKSMSFLKQVLSSREWTYEGDHSFSSTPHIDYIKSWIL